MNSVGSNNFSLKYQKFTPPGCKGIGIQKLELVAKTQFLSVIWITTDAVYALFKWLYRDLNVQKGPWNCGIWRWSLSLILFVCDKLLNSKRVLQVSYR